MCPLLMVFMSSSEKYMYTEAKILFKKSGIWTVHGRIRIGDMCPEFQKVTK